MAFIIGIDTSSRYCSVALFQNETVIESLISTEVMTHAKVLPAFIEQLLTQHQLIASQISAIAICGGPGSYTGLRIGVSFAKGWCYTYQIPLIAISALELTRLQFINNHPNVNANEPLLVARTARKNEIYLAGYNNGQQVIEDVSINFTISAFNIPMEFKFAIIIGDGTDTFLQFAHQFEGKVLDSTTYSAQNLASIAFNKLKLNEIENTAYYTPNYLKPWIGNVPKK